MLPSHVEIEALNISIVNLMLRAAKVSHLKMDFSDDTNCILVLKDEDSAHKASEYIAQAQEEATKLLFQLSPFHEKSPKTRHLHIQELDYDFEENTVSIAWLDSLGYEYKTSSTCETPEWVIVYHGGSSVEISITPSADTPIEKCHRDALTQYINK